MVVGKEAEHGQPCTIDVISVFDMSEIEGYILPLYKLLLSCHSLCRPVELKFLVKGRHQPVRLQGKVTEMSLHETECGRYQSFPAPLSWRRQVWNHKALCLGLCLSQPLTAARHVGNHTLSIHQLPKSDIRNGHSW